MIKQKMGSCIDADHLGSKEVPLIAGRCQSCYWRHRGKVNKAKPAKQAKEACAGELRIFFASQTLVMPRNCEETGQLLPMFPAWLKKSCIAHILPKRPDYGFPSVSLHPMNKIFLHPDVHHDMDNFGKEYILKMKSLPVMKERVKILLEFLTPEEMNRVPPYFL